MDAGISIVKPTATPHLRDGGRGFMNSASRKLVHGTRKSFFLITNVSINA